MNLDKFTSSYPPPDAEEEQARKTMEVEDRIEMYDRVRAVVQLLTIIFADTGYARSAKSELS